MYVCTYIIERSREQGYGKSILKSCDYVDEEETFKTFFQPQIKHLTYTQQARIFKKNDTPSTAAYLNT